MEYDFILASSSPRRLALLSQAGISPKRVESPDVTEEREKGETPLAYVRRMARTKASAVASRYAGENVLAADTIVVMGDRIFAKTDDAEKAKQTLLMLSGRRHRVITAVCLVDKNGKERIRHSVSHVRFKRLSHNELAEYLASGEWRGKAGSYAVQGRAECFVREIIGSYSNIVGLPLCDTVNLLNGIKPVAEERS